MNRKSKKVAERNARIVEYKEKHPDMTVRAIAGVFHVTHPTIVRTLKNGAQFHIGKATS